VEGRAPVGRVSERQAADENSRRRCHYRGGEREMNWPQYLLSLTSSLPE
jgi:hypothetical protein